MSTQKAPPRDVEISQTRTASLRICIILCLLAIAATLVAATAAADFSSSSAASAYAEEIAKTYDYKFGSNPFAPSNATSATGTFIPGENSSPRHAVAPVILMLTLNGGSRLMAMLFASRFIKKTSKTCNHSEVLNSLAIANPATILRRCFRDR